MIAAAPPTREPGPVESTFSGLPDCPARSQAPRTLVLGLGNDILTDDAVGLEVVRALRPRLQDLPDIDLVECMEMGIALLDHITGYRNLVLVDSVQTGRHPPGQLHEVSPADLSVLPRVTPHFLGIGETLRLGRHLDLPMPEEVRIFAVEVEDPFTLGETMSPSLQSALPAILDRIETAARELTAEPCSRPLRAQPITARHVVGG